MPLKALKKNRGLQIGQKKKKHNIGSTSKENPGEKNNGRTILGKSRQD